MKFPEKADLTIIGDTKSVRMNVNLSPLSKISDLCNSYFSQYDEDDIEPAQGHACVVAFYSWLQGQPKVSTEKVIAEAHDLLSKPNATWVFSKDGADQGIIVICAENPENYLESLVREHTKEDPKDETTGAFLAVAAGLDFMFWLQKQVPAVLAENGAVNTEKNKPVYFVASQDECPDRIFFSWEDAVKSEITYLDSFNRDGEKVASHKIADNGEYTTDF